jgi:hypothetical protein
MCSDATESVAPKGWVIMLMLRGTTLDAVLQGDMHPPKRRPEIRVSPRPMPSSSLY